MNPLIQGHSGTTPEMSRNAFSTNQGTNEDDSQSDPHPEAGVFGNQTMRNSGQEDQLDLKTTGFVRGRVQFQNVSSISLSGNCVHQKTEAKNLPGWKM